MASTKDRLIFDSSDADGTSDNVGAYIRSADGTQITHTTVSGKDALDVYMVNEIAVSVDGVYNVSTNTNPDNVGLISHTRAASPGDAEQVERITAASPSSDNIDPADVKAQDVNSFLLGWDGSAWDRLTASSGALDINLASQDIDLSVDADLNDLVADDAPDAGGSLKAGSRAHDGALTAISADNDRADLLSDMYRRIYTNSSPNIGLSSDSVTVGITEVQLDSTLLAGRTKINIQNLGSKDIYVGPTGLALGDGFRVSRGASLDLDLGEDIALYAISSAAGQDVRVMQIG